MVLLASAELRRAPLRFALLVGAVGFLVFLVLFQQALQAGLITGFVGAIRNQSAPVLVYSVDGQRVLQASVIDPELEALVRATPEVEEVGRIGQGTFTVTAGSEMVDASIIGYEEEGIGSPSNLTDGRQADAPGEAVASHVDADRGFAVGDKVVVEPGGLPLEVVGLARDAQLSVNATLFVDYGTYLEAVAARSPGGGEPLPNVLGVVPADGVSDDRAVAAVNARDDRLDALTRADAAAETPGVAQVRQSFQIIFLLYGFVVPLVTGLFFLIITVQKAGALTLLRAVGAPGRRLVGALLLQVLVVVAAGVALGTALFLPLVLADATSLSLRFDPAAVAGWAGILVVLGMASAVLAARRVAAIDPATAATGLGGDR